MSNKYTEKFICLACLERGVSQQLRAHPKDELNDHMGEHFSEAVRFFSSYAAIP